MFLLKTGLRFLSKQEEILALNGKVKQCYILGKYSDALDLAEQAVNLTSNLERNDLVYLTCQNNLALVYKTLGRYEDAIVIYERIKDSYLAQFGQNHASTITIINNLAATYKARKSPDLAIQLLTPLPDLSPGTLQIYVIKASCYKDLDDLHNARAVIEQAEAYVNSTYGKGNVVSVNLLNCKALILKALKEFEEAERLLKEALDIRKEWNGEDHPETIAVRHNLAELYLAWNKKDQADELLTTNIKLMQAAQSK